MLLSIKGETGETSSPYLALPILGVFASSGKGLHVGGNLAEDNGRHLAQFDDAHIALLQVIIDVAAALYCISSRKCQALDSRVEPLLTGNCQSCCLQHCLDARVWKRLPDSVVNASILH